MKKLAFAVMFSLLATAASAQWAQNNVGVYFDPDATTNYLPSVAVGTVVDCYLVGTGLTASAVSGFELKLTIQGGGSLLPTSIAFPTDGINLSNRPDEYVVGYGGPVPTAGGQFVFMQFQTLLTSTDPCCTYLQPVFFASVPGSGAYLGETPEILLPLFNSTGDPLDPEANPAVASVNGLCESAVPNRDTTWGAVKGLYR